MSKPKVEPVDEAAVAALFAEIAHARARPLAIGDGAIDDALGHEGCVAHALATNQCAMPTRKPTRPETAIIAQRTPRA
jgi:hypothetical protein